MSDLTPSFSELLTRNQAPYTHPRRRPPPPKDEFLKEAYRIASHIFALHSHLSATRQAYLSTARPPAAGRISPSTQSNYLTDAQRDALDAETKSVIRSSLSLIAQLESAENIRSSTAEKLLEKKYNSFRSIFQLDDAVREAEESKVRVENAHREAVIWFLKQRLEAVSMDQRERQEIRLQRQIERGKSRLSTGAASGGRLIRPTQSRAAVAREQDEKREEEEALSEDQLKLFAQENEGMLKHYEDALEQVRTAESSLLEISELQTQLANNLTEQTVHIESLMQDSLATEENIQKGNKELKKAAERTSVARSAFFTALIFSSVVFVWDWFI